MVTDRERVRKKETEGGREGQRGAIFRSIVISSFDD